MLISGIPHDRVTVAKRKQEMEAGGCREKEKERNENEREQRLHRQQEEEEGKRGPSRKKEQVCERKKTGDRRGGRG